MLVSFAPQERISDLVRADAVIDLAVAGYLNTNATFWDFESVNTAALSSSHLRPLGCASYLNTFAVTGAGSSVSGHVVSLQHIRIDLSAYRPTPVAVLAEQKLFGMQLMIDLGSSLEAGGASTGCGDAATLALTRLTPVSASGSTATAFDNTGDLLPHTVQVNPGFIDPVARQTWGTLKALYR